MSQIAVLMENATEPRLADIEILEVPGPHPVLGVFLYVTEELPEDAPEEFVEFAEHADLAENGEIKLPLGGCTLVMN